MDVSSHCENRKKTLIATTMPKIMRYNEIKVDLHELGQTM